MSTYTHGRCPKCKLILRWQGFPRLRDACCPRCGRELARTAARLAKRIPIVNELPLTSPLKEQ